MKKQITLIIGLLLFLNLYASESGWINIRSKTPSAANLSLVSSDIESTVLKLSLSGFSLNQAETQRGQQSIVEILDGTPLLMKGCPDLPKIAVPIIIPDNSEMGSFVASSKYKDYTNIEIAPSKGSFSRKIDPASVPYIYGENYTKNEFFPNKLTDLNDPYIIRDFRGQTVNFYPIQYNPVTKTLRVYYEIVVKVEKTGENGINQLERNREISPTLDPEFNQIYSKRFVNYSSLANSSSLRSFSPVYNPVNEEGSMLIISHNSFLSIMQPFVAWKNLKGIYTEMVDVATIGTSAAITTYIKNYYAGHPKLKYVLLVGDDTEVPSSKSGSAASDNKYGCLVGTDSYVEVFVGRFSGTTVTHIQTQIDRTLQYEKGMNGTETYLNKGVGLASGNEPDDMKCIDGIITQMKGYTYGTTVKYSSSPATNFINKINQGQAGFVAHSGHGSKTSLASISFSTSSCASLTNTAMWPFMFCLACDVGIFTNGTCLAESMVRATSNGKPSGFIATQMAAISQPWYEPYDALKEQVAILTEQYQNNSKWTFGGIAMNGCFKMLDNFPSTGKNVSDTWVTFGDPSLLVFTDNPIAMTASHASTINLGATTFAVNCNIKGALVSLTVGGNIIGTAYSTGGATTIAINPALATTLTTMQVTITAKNKIPYSGNVTISGTLSVDGKDVKEAIGIYPNPASQSFSINVGDIQKENMSITVFDVFGKKLLTLTNPSIINNTTDMDVSSLASGVYYLVIKTDAICKTGKVTVLR